MIEKKGQPLVVVEEAGETGTQKFGEILREGMKIYAAGVAIDLVLIVGYVFFCAPFALLSASIGLGLKKIAIERDNTSKSYAVAMDYLFKTHDLIDQEKEILQKKSIQQNLLEKESQALGPQHSEIDTQRHVIKIQRITNQIERMDSSIIDNKKSIEKLKQTYEKSIRLLA